MSVSVWGGGGGWGGGGLYFPLLQFETSHFSWLQKGIRNAKVMLVEVSGLGSYRDPTP